MSRQTSARWLMPLELSLSVLIDASFRGRLNSELEYDLAEVLAAAHRLEGGLGVGPGKHLVDDRADAVLLDGLAHGLEGLARAHRQPLQLGRIADQGGRVEWVPL